MSNQSNNKVEVTNAELMAQIEALKAERAKLEAAIKDASSKRVQVTMQVKTCKNGTGFVLQGMGMPKFFYKQQARTLLGDNAESAKLRASILAWVDANESILTDKK